MADQLDDLVTSEDIAQRLGLAGRRTVNTLLARGTDGFPAPVMDRGKVRLWLWSEVHAWAERTGRLPGS
jgi:hypothetical protein